MLIVCSAAWPVLIALDRGRIPEEAFHEVGYLWHLIQSCPCLESLGCYQIHIRKLTFLIQSQNHEKL